MRRFLVGISGATIATWFSLVGCGEDGDGGDGGSATRAGGGNAGGSDNGAAGAPEPSGDAGSSSSDGLVSCDPEQASCKMPPGACPTMQVREVIGTCWGDCVMIEQCACRSAAECPDSNQYTCWMGRHCGPYVN
jgi:hypothetical protein